MKIFKQFVSFGSLSIFINYASVILLICLISGELKPSHCRPRSSRGGSSLEIFNRDSRIVRESKTDKSSASKSVRSPYLRLRTVPAAEILTKETSSHVLECEAGGSPTPTIHWLKNEKRILQSDASDSEDDHNVEKGVLSLSFTRSRLYLDCVQPSDSATYSCIASTPFNRVSANTHLKVLPTLDADKGYEENSVSLCLAKKSYGYPARIHMWTHNRLEMIGSNVQLFCRSSGIPQPITKWIGPEENQLANSEKYQILDNGDLIIKNLSWDDMGSYQCTAENQHGSDRTSIFLYPTLPE